MYKYKNKETGKIEEVEEVLWQWQAFYRDGTDLMQYDQHGVFHRVEEINQPVLHYLIMRNYQTGKKIVMEFPDHCQLIHFYINEVTDYKTPQEKTYRAFVFGYEHRTGKQYFVVTFNNDLVVTDDYKKIDLYSGKLNQKVI